MVLVAIFIFGYIKLIARSVPVLKLPEKGIMPSSRNISVTKKSKVSAENIDIKVSALPTS